MSSANSTTSSSHKMNSNKLISLKKAIKTAQISLAASEPVISPQNAQMLPSSAQQSVVSLLSRSMGASATKSELTSTSLTVPDSSGILSLCYVQRFNRMYVGLSNGAIAYYTTSKWKLRGCLSSVHKGRIYSLIHVPPCWLWSVCDTGQIAVCKISGQGSSLSVEHSFSVHNGQMVKSLLWSPSFEGASVDSLSLKGGQPRLFPGQTDGLHV